MYFSIIFVQQKLFHFFWQNFSWWNFRGHQSFPYCLMLYTTFPLCHQSSLLQWYLSATNELITSESEHGTWDSTSSIQFTNILFLKHFFLILLIYSTLWIFLGKNKLNLKKIQWIRTRILANTRPSCVLTCTLVTLLRTN